MENKSNDYYFNILGVNRHSTKKEIKQAFRNQIKKWHPDKFPDDKLQNEEANEKSKLLNEAYSVLENYDSSINNSSDSITPTAKEKNKNTNIRHEISRINVISTNIRSIGYNALLMILQIEFMNGGVYEYYSVPETIFIELMDAKSKGKYAKRNIYYSYRYIEV